MNDVANDYHRRTLIVAFDVADLTEQELANLERAAARQADENIGNERENAHPAVNAVAFTSDCPVGLVSGALEVGAPDEAMIAEHLGIQSDPEMALMICQDGAETDSIPLIDGNDSFNREAERGALDRAYEMKESDPDSVVSIVVTTRAGV